MSDVECLDYRVPYAMGLDVGIASAGYATVFLDDNNRGTHIDKVGVLIIPSTDDPKTGKTACSKRRSHRSSRRNVSRRKLRKADIRKTIVSSGLVSEEELEHLFDGHIEDAYLLRARALDEPITNGELARILIHISQRRGFKSNRINEKNSDDGKLLAATKENELRMTEGGYRTVGEMFARDPIFHDKKRNSDGVYVATVTRAQIISEVYAIFAAQQAFGNSAATDSLRDSYIDILQRQRSFDEGPGAPSYMHVDGTSMIQKMVGHCTFESDELRAPKNSYSFSRFQLLQDLNNLRFGVPGAMRKLTPQEHDIVVQMCYDRAKVTCWDIRKALKLPMDGRFNLVTYRAKEKKVSKKKKDTDSASEAAQAEKNTKTEQQHEETIEELVKRCEDGKNINALSGHNSGMKATGYHGVRYVLNSTFEGTEVDGEELFEQLTEDNLDDIFVVLSMWKTPEKVCDELERVGIQPVVAKAIAESDLASARFGHLSIKACRNIIPFLETPFSEQTEDGDWYPTYDKACLSAGYDFRTGSANARDNSGSITIPNPSSDDLSVITSPTAKKVVRQVIKLYNAIVQNKGYAPTIINIELARELAKSKKVRDEIDKKNKKNQAKNRQDRVEAEKIFSRYISSRGMSAHDVLKYSLWKEQKETSYYSCMTIGEDKLFTDTEVDHIIPYSCCFDNSRANKVLVLTRENQEKGKRTPLQWLEEKHPSYVDKDALMTRINREKDTKKQQNLLCPGVNDAVKKDFIARNLQDTQMIAVFVKSYIQRYVSEDVMVRCLPGAVTSYLRSRWGLQKIRSAGDQHHAVDAILIACTTPSLVRAVSVWLGKKEENPYDRTIDKYIPLPLSGDHAEFLREIQIRVFSENPAQALKDANIKGYDGRYSQIKPMIVVRREQRKTKGALHEETIYSKKRSTVNADGKIDAVYRVPVESLKYDAANDEIVNFYKPEADPKTYAALKAHIVQYGKVWDKDKKCYKLDGNGNFVYSAKQAFETPFFQPGKKPGTFGHQVKHVRCVKTNVSSMVEVLHGKGLAMNSEIVRVDVYYVEDKGYFCVPVYTMDAANGRRPLKAMPKNTQMSTDDFLFSLYKDSLFVFQREGVMMELVDKTLESGNIPLKVSASGELLYYSSFDISSGRISFRSHDNAYSGRIGMSNLARLEKLSIDLLGNIEYLDAEGA